MEIALPPNFRDFGMMVDDALLRILANLQRKHGEAFASEAGLRTMVWQDTGHLPGVGTIPKALDRLELQGLIGQEWLKPGGIMPGGGPCTYGTRLVRVPTCRNERRRLKGRAEDRRRDPVRYGSRREGVTNRANPRAFAELFQARAKLAGAFAPKKTGEGAAELEARREELTRQARELAARWDAEDRGKGPPAGS